MDRIEEFLVLFAPLKKNKLGRDTSRAANINIVSLPQSPTGDSSLIRGSQRRQTLRLIQSQTKKERKVNRSPHLRSAIIYFCGYAFFSSVSPSR